jgi:hypothetical protein
MYFPLPKSYHQADAETGFDIRPNVPSMQHRFADATLEVWSNELGCFDRPFPAVGDYALLVGDSSSWGYARFEEKWSTLLQQMIGLRVASCGVSGFGTRQEYVNAVRKLKRIGRPPKFILLQYTFLNDLAEDTLFPMMTVRNGWLFGQRQFADFDAGRIVESAEPTALDDVKLWLLSNSALYAVARAAGKTIQAALAGNSGADASHAPATDHHLLAWLPLDIPWLAGAWAAHLQNLLRFQTLAAELGVPLVVVYSGPVPDHAGRQIATLRRAYGPDWVDLGNANRVPAFLARQGVPVIDLTAPMMRHAGYTTLDEPGEPRLAGDLLWKVDGHASPRGNRLIALLAARGLKDLGIVQQSERLTEVTATFEAAEPGLDCGEFAAACADTSRRKLVER